MALSSDADHPRRHANRTGSLELSSEPGDWASPEKPARDWKKLILVLGLGALSWVATYVGMLELIAANTGDLPLVHKVIIGFSVAMLMTMIIWLLDQLFAPVGTLTKLIYAAGYLFLTIISVGFGFGFYWKVLESRSESSRSAESAVTQVQSSMHAASTRLEQLQATLEQLTTVSTQKAELERSKGTSCPNSKPGDGPRRKLREEDAQRFNFAAEFVKGRVSAIKGDVAALDGDLTRIVGDDKTTIDAKSGTRNEFMRALGHKLDLTVTGFNAFRTDPQLKQLRADLADRAERSSFQDGKSASFSCPDAQLAQALRGVTRAIDQLPELEKPKIAAVEGSEATIEAFRRLTTTFYGMLAFKLPPSPDELRELQKKAVQTVEASPAGGHALSGEQAGLSKRDYVPLSIAIFVDLCLFLVSMGRPVNRLARLVPKMREAERGPVIQILSRFNDIHRDRQIRENFEIFRHVVFDFHGDYYVAVPLDAPRRMNPAEREELRLEAQLLANLFASFEKERIFARVYNPLLTSSAIRRRLARQGSKFDNSDAFRVYRFRDGAWSEIILGAVMGAARRVEADKRRRAEEPPREPAKPSLELPEQSPPQAPVATGEDIDLPWPKAHREAARASSQSFRPGVDRREAVHTATEATGATQSLKEKFGPYAAHVWTAYVAPSTAGDDAGIEWPPPPEADVRLADDRVDDGPSVTADQAAPENVIPLRPQLPADRGSAPPPQPKPAQETAAVAAGCASPPVRDRIDVVLARETATFTVPMTEVSIPQALRHVSPMTEAATRNGIAAGGVQLELSLPDEPVVAPLPARGTAREFPVSGAEPVKEDLNTDDARLAAMLARIPAE